MTTALKDSFVPNKLSKGFIYVECHNSRYYVFEWIDQFRLPKTLHIGDFKSATKFYSSKVGRSWSKLVV